MICTDSFHSSVFAFLFDKPFIVFDREQSNKENMNSRIETLINKFQLKNRKYNNKRISEENLKHDYSKVYAILEKEKSKSIKFLENSLDIKDGDKMEKEKRIVGIDIIRILSMFGIIGLHVINNGGVLAALDIHTIKYYVVLLLLIILYSSVNIFAISIVSLFKKIKCSNNNAKKIVKYFAEATFSVYIIHSHKVIYDYLIKDAFSFMNNYNGIIIMILVLLSIVAIYLLCCIIDFIRKGIFKLLLINSLIEKMGAKLDKILE